MLPPDSVRVGVSSPRRLHVELADELIGVLADRAPPQQAATSERRRSVVEQHEVLPTGEVADHAVAHPLLGHVGEPRPTPARGDAPSTSTPPIDDRAGGAVRRPAIASASSRCPLPDTPAMPTISPARTSSDTSSTRRRRGRRRRLEAAHLEHDVAGRPGGAIGRELRPGRPTIRSASSWRRRASGRTSPVTRRRASR